MTETPKVQNLQKMKNDTAPAWDLFGDTPRFIAAGLRLRPELTLAYMASTLGGLSGPFARMNGFLGERHHPALPLVLSVRHPGRARHLEQLTIDPALNFDEWNRRKSQVLDPTHFHEHHGYEASAIRQENIGLLDALDASFRDADKIAAAETTLLRHRQHFQPAVMLTAPDPKTFDEVRGAVFDESPLVVDTGGRLIRNATLPHPEQRSWQSLLERIIEGARGGIDQPAGKGSPDTLSRVRRTRTPFLLHLPSELSGHTLMHPASANVFEVALLLPTTGIDGRLVSSKANFQLARRAVQQYREALNQVLWSRMDNSGVAFELTQPIPELLDGQDELHDRIDGLPSAVRRSCGGLANLPLRLLWTSLLLDDPQAKRVQSFVPGALQAARWCVDSQIELVTTALEAEERREQEEAAALMLRKLGEIPALPCKFADIARKYRHQRRELLEPTLQFLSDEKLVSWKPDLNQIDLCDCAQSPEWLDQSSRATGQGKLTLPTRSPV